MGKKIRSSEIDKRFRGIEDKFKNMICIGGIRAHETAPVRGDKVAFAVYKDSQSELEKAFLQGLGEVFLPQITQVIYTVRQIKGNSKFYYVLCPEGWTEDNMLEELLGYYVLNWDLQKKQVESGMVTVAEKKKRRKK
jgi:hypothetical protein